MRQGSQTLHDQVVPGPGSGQLAGLAGVVQLTMDDDGTHRYELTHAL